MNESLTFATIDGQKVSLETIRIRFGWPEGGVWDFDLTRNQWRYQYSKGPETISITAGPASCLAVCSVIGAGHGLDTAPDLCL